MEMIGYPYLGYAVLSVLYCGWGVFNLFSPGWCYYIKKYNWGFASSASPYLTLLGSGFLALICYESTKESVFCSDLYIITLYLCAALFTAFGKSIL